MEFSIEKSLIPIHFGFRLCLITDFSSCFESTRNARFRYAHESNNKARNKEASTPAILIGAPTKR